MIFRKMKTHQRRESIKYSARWIRLVIIMNNHANIYRELNTKVSKNYNRPLNNPLYQQKLLWCPVLLPWYSVLLLWCPVLLLWCTLLLPWYSVLLLWCPVLLQWCPVLLLWCTLQSSDTNFLIECPPYKRKVCHAPSREKFATPL